jgi:Rieske 2Fe-2S family protein
VNSGQAPLNDKENSYGWVDNLSRLQDGWSLPSAFYCQHSVYQADLDRIWRRGWLFATHSCELKEPGTYTVLELDTDSILITRGTDGQVRAFHNVCRHRGSLLCTERNGKAARIVCPYHQWSYDLAGRLTGCRGMPDDFDKTRFSLKPVAVREITGLIFINILEAPETFDAAHASMGPVMKPQRIERARVAFEAEYRVAANWKVVWENNRECYHCNSNHPEYIRANFDHYNSDDTTPEIRKRLVEVTQRMESKWAATGLAPTHRETGMTRFPDAARQIWYSANRTVLVDGWVSETLDGKQVAPLMGDYLDPDVGTVRVRTLPNFWMHASCDHVVTTRLLPAGPETTLIRVAWLVDERAVADVDYQLDRMLPFWKNTSEQDWEICENQQRGIRSSAYEPGPYSPAKEYNVDAFVRWYRTMLSLSPSAKQPPTPQR